jgi:phosphatidylglycerophosphate synthase
VIGAEIPSERTAAAVGPVGAGSAASERESFWSGYWRSLKPLAVEEPIDVWVHRPLAYVVARALLPTPVSPNLVTLVSILFGLTTAYCLLASFSGHMLLAGVCLFLSAVFDCADGQLARMRGTSSAFGRMLDGVADLIVSVAAVGGGIYVVWSRYHEPWWLGLVALGLCAATAVTGSFHTGMYDHYKNVYLKLTNPTFEEGEDYETALERRRAVPDAELGLVARLCWPIYLFYVNSQEGYVRSFDPHTASSLGRLPRFDAERARIYARHAEPLLVVWKRWFGFGSLMFGIALSAALDVLEWYMLARLIGLNLVYYGWLRPAQRRASRLAFREMGLEPARA